jgi:hypothetical protein
MPSHSKTAGGAYLEALGVSLILVLLFACAQQFARGAQAGLLRARDERATAWSKALAGCEADASRPVACNEPARPDSWTAEHDVAAFIAGKLAESEAR